MLVPVYQEIFNKFRLLKTKMKSRTRNREIYSAFFSYLAVEIAKIKPRQILCHQNREIKIPIRYSKPKRSARNNGEKKIYHPLSGV